MGVVRGSLSLMRASELYIGRPDLMTADELEEYDFVDVTAEVPMIPLWYRDKLLNSINCIPDEEGEQEFLKRNRFGVFA